MDRIDKTDLVSVVFLACGVGREPDHVSVFIFALKHLLDCHGHPSVLSHRRDFLAMTSKERNIPDCVITYTGKLKNSVIASDKRSNPVNHKSDIINQKLLDCHGTGVPRNDISA